MRYSRRTSNYPKRITLFDSTRMMSMANRRVIDVETLRIDRGLSFKKEFTDLMSMVDLVAISVEILKINSGCSSDKEFTELIHMNP